MKGQYLQLSLGPWLEEEECRDGTAIIGIVVSVLSGKGFDLLVHSTSREWEQMMRNLTMKKMKLN